MLFSVIPAPHQVRDKLQPESSNFNAFWMPDQVRHDDFETFYRIVNPNKYKKAGFLARFMIAD
jgi:hypothetical protein